MLNIAVESCPIRSVPHSRLKEVREPSPASAPAVSVVIPAYNTAPFIGETLKSVFRQTFRDYEVIVVNDGSPDSDELERVLEPYRGRIVYIKQENRGPSAARNAGIRASRASLIAFLDSDDVWEPDYLAVQVEMMLRDPAIDVLYPNALVFGDSPDSGRELMELSPSEGEITFEKVATQKCTVLTCVTARREAVVRAGMYDEALKWCEDFDLWLRILHRGGRIAYHRRVLVRYRRRRGSLSSESSVMCANVLRVLDKLKRTIELTVSQSEGIRDGEAYAAARKNYFDGKAAFLDGDAGRAFHCLSRANAYFHRPKIALLLFFLRFVPGFTMRAWRIRNLLRAQA